MLRQRLGNLNLNFFKVAVINILILLLVHNSVAQDCKLKDNDKEWLEHTAQLWQTVSRESLRLKPALLPWTILVDEACVWHINPNLSLLKPQLTGSFSKTKVLVSQNYLEVCGVPHNKEVSLPNNEKIQVQPSQLISFASTYSEKPFFVFSMPEVWRKSPGFKSDDNREILILAVFVHEMTHTQQQSFYKRLDQIERQYKFPIELNDDIIQDYFGQREDFRRAYERERDLLYQVVSETSKQRKRALAAKFLKSFRNRQQQFFVGKDAHYAEIENMFLTMEGVAQWAAYKAARREGMTETQALKMIRRGGKRWSQDEGLALFLVIDSLSTGWQPKIFSKSQLTIIDLLNNSIRAK